MRKEKPGRRNLFANKIEIILLLIIVSLLVANLFMLCTVNITNTKEEFVSNSDQERAKISSKEIFCEFYLDKNFSDDNISEKNKETGELKCREEIIYIGKAPIFLPIKVKSDIIYNSL